MSMTQSAYENQNDKNASTSPCVSRAQPSAASLLPIADDLVEAPLQIPHVVGRRTSLQRTPAVTHIATDTSHDLTRELQLIGFNLDGPAVQLGVSLSWGAAAQDREKWRKLAARLPLAPVETNPDSVRTSANGSHGTDSL
jgi:hypothetical protein